MLSVIIPAFNEAERIGPTLIATRAWLAAQDFSSEILVVDDGSSDETAKVVGALANTKDLPSITLVGSFPNRGKGHAVKLGMLAARGDLRLFMDADGAVAITELPRLLERIRGVASIAIGSRRAPGASAAVKPPWYRRAWSRVANRIVRLGLLDGIQDTQCGFKLFRGEEAEALFRRVSTTGWGFDLEVLVVARELGLSIAEVPVAYRHDPRSRIRPWRDLWKIFNEFLRIRRAHRSSMKRVGWKSSRPLLPANQGAK
ncbi:MAG: glycosyltransferase family 2 protein [Deltaproteobacteria bacterium]|nr:glycosyltransferase family 2 protein [Deltaproteobacteria bacterium]